MTIDMWTIVTSTISGLLVEWIKPKLFRRPPDVNAAILQQLAQSPLDQALYIQVAPIVRAYLDRLGSPTSETYRAIASPKGTTGAVQRFTGRRGDPVGASVYKSAHGAFPVWGEIARCFESLGGTSSRLGFPTSLEVEAKRSHRGTTGRVQRFEGHDDAADRWDDTYKLCIGVSIYSSQYGTFPVWGTIGQCYESYLGTVSRLGFPTSAEGVALPSQQGTTGQVQRFEGSPEDTCQVSIYASEYGAWPVWGEIACRYEACGGTTSHYGYPISGETKMPQATGEGTRWVQHFEGGDLWV